MWWGTTLCDLCVTSEQKLPLYCSIGAIGRDSQGGALLLLWTSGLRDAFPPIPLLTGAEKNILWRGHCLSPSTLLTQTVLVSRTSVSVSPPDSWFRTGQDQTPQLRLSSPPGMVFWWVLEAEHSCSFPVQLYLLRVQKNQPKLVVWLNVNASPPGCSTTSLTQFPQAVGGGSF